MSLSKPHPEPLLRDLAADHALVEGLLAGEPHANQQLHRMLSILMSTLARRYALSRTEREDIVSEIIRRLHVNSADRLQNFSFRCRLEEWLGVVALNVVRDQKRADQRRFQREQHATIRAEALHELPEHELVIDRLSAAEDIRFAMDGLDPLTVQALQLRFVQGLPWRAIALLTGLNEAALTSRVYRAVELMTTRLSARDAAYAAQAELPGGAGR